LIRVWRIALQHRSLPCSEERGVCARRGIPVNGKLQRAEAGKMQNSQKNEQKKGRPGGRPFRNSVDGVA
jgi:hypothetical protein